MEKKETISIYSCGPTVYDKVHIGNLRIYIFQDFFAKTLKFLNPEKIIKRIINITDIDDKILNKITTKKELHYLTSKYADYFYKKLFNLKININEICFVKCVDIIPETIKFIKYLQTLGKIIITNKGILYNEKTDCVNSEVSEKNFTLWKFSKDGDIGWISPWGMGRPGWHLECASIIFNKIEKKYLNYHLGGLDLKFPHHFNESLLLSDCNFSIEKYIYVKELKYNGKKMSKSLKNSVYLEDISDNKSFLRYFFLNNNYDKIFTYSIDKLNNSKSQYYNLLNKIFLIFQKNFTEESYKYLYDNKIKNNIIQNIKELCKNYKSRSLILFLNNLIVEYSNEKISILDFFQNVFIINKILEIFDFRQFFIPEKLKLKLKELEYNEDQFSRLNKFKYTIPQYYKIKKINANYFVFFKEL